MTFYPTTTRVVVDTGASDHIISVPNLPADRGQQTNIIGISGGTTGVWGYGSIVVFDLNGKPLRIKLQKVILSATVDVHLLSLGQLRANGWDFDFGSVRLSTPDGTVVPVRIIDYVFYIPNIPPASVKFGDIATVEVADKRFFNSIAELRAGNGQLVHEITGSRLAHLRFSHFSLKKLRASLNAGAKLGDLLDGPPSADDDAECAGCLEGLSRMPSKERAPERSLEIGQVIHCDPQGPLTLSVTGHKYWTHFTDEASRYTTIYLLRSKDDVATAFPHFVSAARALRRYPRVLRTDNAQELVRGALERYLGTEGIRSEQTPPYDPQAGGKHESVIGVLWSHTEAVMRAGNVPQRYWPYVLLQTNRIRNNLVHSATGRIPALLWQGHVDDLSRLYTTGCSVYVHIPKHLRNKHQPKSKMFVYLGHKDAHTCYVMDPDTGSVLQRGHILRAVELFTSDGRVASLSDRPLLARSAGDFRPAAEGGAEAANDEAAGTVILPDEVRASHEEYMINDEWWAKLENSYGPHSHEACSNVDGSNSRLESRTHSNLSFFDWKPRDGSNVFLNPPYSQTQEFIDHAYDLWESNPSIGITAIVPDWAAVDTSQWKTVEHVDRGTNLYLNPDRSDPGSTRWTVLVLRLDPTVHDDRIFTEPKQVSRRGLGRNIKVLEFGYWQEEEVFMNGTVKISSSDHNEVWVYAVGLVQYCRSAWSQLLEKANGDSKLFRTVTTIKYPEDVGITVSYDISMKEYGIGYMDGSIDYAHEEDITLSVKITAFLSADLTPETCNPNPIMTFENRANIYLPPSDKHLARMRAGPLKDLLLMALGDEINNYEQQSVFGWTIQTKGRKPINCRVLFDLVWNPLTGFLVKPKCRIVARGDRQVEIEDYDPFATYASTPKLSTGRFWLWSCIQLGFKMDEWDIKAAYLHSNLKEEIIMIPPEGFSKFDRNGNKMVWKLLKSVYGLKQAGHNWMRDLFGFFKKYGMEQCGGDTSMWFLERDGKVILLLFVHTDDGKIGYGEDSVRDEFMHALKSTFNVGSEKQKIDRIFNMKVQHHDDGSVSLCQATFISDLCKQYNIVPDPKVTCPMSPTYRLELGDPSQSYDMNHKPFLSLLSAMFWIGRCTRWDIMASLVTMSRASSCPTPLHWKALVKVLKYLQNTAAWSLAIRKDASPAVMRIYCDANHGTDDDTGRSISGQLIMFGDTVIDWSSKHQPYVSLHSGQAETISAAVGATHVLYWHQMFDQIFKVKPETTMLLDSTTAKAVLSNPIHTTHMKHIRIKLLFTRDLVAAGVFVIIYVPGPDNPSDALTKAVSMETLRRYFQEMLSRGGGKCPTVFVLAIPEKVEEVAKSKQATQSKSKRPAEKNPDCAQVLDQWRRSKNQKK